MLDKKPLLSHFLVLLSFTLLSCNPGDGSSDPVIPPTAGKLIITEVGSAFYTNSSFWIEVYNDSTQSANLSRYTYWTYGYSAADSNVAMVGYILPSLTVQPGSYAVIRGKVSDDVSTMGSTAYIIQSGRTPFWNDTYGFAELVLDGVTSDFVLMGTTAVSPETAGAWIGGSTPILPNDTLDDYGYSIARDGLLFDSNQSSDWTLHSFATPGGPNDVTSNDDTDSDGIPDCAEVSGGTFAGLPLYEWGARVGTKDIFIHIDYMNSTDEGVTPRREALQKVVDAFNDFDGDGLNNPDIAIHFDVGDLFDNAAGSDPADFDLDDGEHKVPFSAGVTLGKESGVANLYDYKQVYMDLAKKQVFHYLLFANSQQADGSSGSSGLAEMNGNDFLVSLGGAGLNSGTATATNYLINYQAATIMHEFGHNLGLGHGGYEAANYKPNYISIMNYLYQLQGIPALGATEDNRYRKEYSASILNWSYYNSVVLDNGPSDDYNSFVIDYSHGTSHDLVESALAESAGISGATGSVADYNIDGDTTGSFGMDINYTSGTRETLSDYDDWTNINLFYTRNYRDDITGKSLTETYLWTDIVGDDHQEIYPEPPIRIPGHE